MGDASKLTVTLRDVILVLAGCMAMYGAQLATQWGIRSDIRDIVTRLDEVKENQAVADRSLQTQIDEWRGETKLNRVNIENTQKELSELKGLIIGAGVKGVQK
jgi:hypothetical protein